MPPPVSVTTRPVNVMGREAAGLGGDATCDKASAFDQGTHVGGSKANPVTTTTGTPTITRSSHGTLRGTEGSAHEAGGGGSEAGAGGGS